MKDEMTHAESISVIAEQAEEIERLNSQVAMLREALILMRNSAESYGKAWAAAHVADYAALVSGSAFEKFELLDIAQKRLKSVPDALEASPSDWLKSHDAKIRDEAMEEAANVLGIPRISRNAIRALKGKP